jgi:hypothetical protein
MTVTCPGCGHSDEYEGDAQAEVLACGECGARIAHGLLMPNLTVHPHPDDKRFVSLRAETVKDGAPVSVTLTIDRGLGGLLARELLSVCP